MLGELYTAESMTQIYAFLHTFMKEVLKDLSKLFTTVSTSVRGIIQCHTVFNHRVGRL